MLKSVYQNGGFYIGKYETGVEETPSSLEGSGITYYEGRVYVIKRNVCPYNMMTCSEEQTLASNMEAGEYTTSLMFGVQWDLVLKYLETKGTPQADLKTDSKTWENYCNNLWDITNSEAKYVDINASKRIWVSTPYGASDDFCKQGIYDLAGNISEWTLEYFAFNSNSSRGEITDVVELKCLQVVDMQGVLII